MRSDTGEEVVDATRRTRLANERTHLATLGFMLAGIVLGAATVIVVLA